MDSVHVPSFDSVEAGAPGTKIEIPPEMVDVGTENIEIPIEYLARELYQKSELLLPESGRPWGELSEHEHNFYRLLVYHLLAFPDVVRAALNYACDHDKLGVIQPR